MFRAAKKVKLSGAIMTIDPTAVIRSRVLLYTRPEYGGSGVREHMFDPGIPEKPHRGGIPVARGVGPCRALAAWDNVSRLTFVCVCLYRLYLGDQRTQSIAAQELPE
jgi:hypothetical protein